MEGLHESLTCTEAPTLSDQNSVAADSRAFLAVVKEEHSVPIIDQPLPL